MSVETITIPKAEYDSLLEKLEDLEDNIAYEDAIKDKSDSMPHEYVVRLIKGENPLLVFREWQGYNQSSLAKASNVNRTQIADIEAGRSKPSVDTLKKLAETLNAEMGELEEELDELVNFASNGGGFGGLDAVEQHQREIDLLKFKITRRDNMKIAIVSALIGAIVAAFITTLNSVIG